MDLKKIGRALLFPHISIMIILIPVSVVFLIPSMVLPGSESAVAIVSYVLAAYTLTVWCFRIPRIIDFFKCFRENNRYYRHWKENERLRVRVSLYIALIINTAYAALQLGLGLFHHSFWYYSLAGYYISLALMRLFLARHATKYAPGERMREELLKYRGCAIVFLLINLTLSVMVFFMIYWNRTFNHNDITTITMAAYTFTAFVLAIVNIVKYRKYNSPVYSASKAIGLTAACVSVITLESTMLTTFGGDDIFMRRIMLAFTGGAVSAFIVAMAVYMIMRSTKILRKIKAEEKIGAE